MESLEYENREPFDEEQAAKEFEEIYKANLVEPDEDLPDWVKDTVDLRILAMYFMPEKIYRTLSEQDAENEEKFDALDEQVDEAYEDMVEDLPEEYEELLSTLDDLEDSYVISIDRSGDELELKLEGFDCLRMRASKHIRAGMSSEMRNQTASSCTARSMWKTESRRSI